MGGLNEAARAFISAKNNPASLQAELNSFHTVVFEENEVLLGLGALDGNEIKRVYTATTAQGHGVGTAIMSHLEAEARLRGLDYIEVEASPTSVTFYKRLGYKRIRPGRTKHGDAVFTFVIMRKMLE